MQLSFVLQCDGCTDSTLILHWVPNITIKRNPNSIDSPVGGSPRHSDVDPDSDSHISHLILSAAGGKPSSDSIQSSDTCVTKSKGSDISDSKDIISSLSTSHTLDGTNHKVLTTSSLDDDERSTSNKQSDTLLLDDLHITSDCDDTISISSGSTGGPDSERSCSPTSDVLSICDVISLTETAESIAQSHNLLFPVDKTDGSVSPTHLSRPSVFSVNLGKQVIL